MAKCITLTKGRELACLGANKSGIKAVGIIPWEEGLVVGKDGKVTTLDATITKIYRYQVKNSGNIYTETSNIDTEARTIAFTGELAVVLQGYDGDLRNEVAILSKGEVILFAERNDGEIIVIGTGFGALMTTSVATTGGAKTDFNGYTLTFTSDEIEPAMFMDATGKTAYGKVASEK